jgi:hypothetical protein
MSTRNWDNAQQHMELQIYSEEEEEPSRSTQSASGD